MSFEVFEPATVGEAFHLLTDSGIDARPVGGGTALMLMMKARLYQPDRLVSLRRLGDPFTGLELVDRGFARIGAMTTFSELESSTLIAHYFPVVVETMKTLANVRVRNVATVGGNIAHADPHLDLPPVWISLDAEAVITNAGGERVVPVEDIITGYYETVLVEGDIITELRVPLREGWRSRYVKVTTRAAHDWPALGIAISLKQADGLVRDARVVLSAALDKPTRLVSAEKVLIGAPLDAATAARIGDAACEEAEITSDSRGSAAYKKHLLRVHLSRTIESFAGTGL